VSSIQSPTRWGIVGLGWVAADFVAPALVKSSGSRLAACLGSSIEKGRVFAERFGVERVHDDIEALMHDPGVDAVYIALPNALHHAAVLAAARGKKHVLCEKPFALSVTHAREMVASCRDAGVILRIAHQLRSRRPSGACARSYAPGGSGGSSRSPSSAPPVWDRGRHGARMSRKAASFSTWGCIYSTSSPG
jgi:predicted dehydrogenase